MSSESNNSNGKIRIKKIFYFGNPFIAQDSLAIKVAERLKKEFNDIDFIYIQNTFQLIDINLNESILLDVVQGIQKPALLLTKDISQSSVSTTHDFDLGFFLKLTDKKSTILGIPQFYDENKAFQEAREIIIQLSSNSL